MELLKSKTNKTDLVYIYIYNMKSNFIRCVLKLFA